jgi:hypothetical protein
MSNHGDTDQLKAAVNIAEAIDRTVILIDVSSSMETLVGAMRRIDALATVLAATVQGTPGVRIFAFNNGIIELDNAVSEHGINLPEPSGSTALAEAIEEIAQLRPRQLLIITDGEPDDERAALTQAKLLNCVIHVRFVGDERNRAAIAFCRNLALCSVGGVGRAMVSDLRQPAQLTSDIRRLLLTGPRP